MGNNEKHPAFQTYRQRRILVSVDEAEATRVQLVAGMTYGRVDVYVHRPLEHRTIESLARMS